MKGPASSSAAGEANQGLCGPALRDLLLAAAAAGATEDPWTQRLFWPFAVEEVHGRGAWGACLLARMALAEETYCSGLHLKPPGH